MLGLQGACAMRKRTHPCNRLGGCRVIQAMCRRCKFNLANMGEDAELAAKLKKAFADEDEPNEIDDELDEDDTPPEYSGPSFCC